jgi:hypothetical protein
MTRADDLATLRRRMLQANAEKERRHTRWEAWQAAATDYWVALHPDLARFRRGDADREPTAQDLLARAEQVRAAMDGIPTDWRLRPPSDERTEHLARVGWFHELLVGLYEPVDAAIQRARRGDRSRLETLLRFLETDVYCFRSGYVKADIIRVVTRLDLDASEVERLRVVVLDVVDGYDRREFRAYVRLARRVDSPGLREALRARRSSPDPRVRRHADWVLAGIEEPTPRKR